MAQAYSLRRFNNALTKDLRRLRVVKAPLSNSEHLLRGIFSPHNRHYVAKSVLLVDNCTTLRTQCTTWDRYVSSVCTCAPKYLSVCAHMLSWCEFVRNSSTTFQAQFLKFSSSLSRDSKHCGAGGSKLWSFDAGCSYR